MEIIEIRQKCVNSDNEWWCVREEKRNKWEVVIMDDKVFGEDEKSIRL